MFSACSTMFQGGIQIVLGTSFTAEYDEYRYSLDDRAQSL